MSTDHGTYARYSSSTSPCRCEACRKAKADYMRARRAAARAIARRYSDPTKGRYVAKIDSHGTRFGYEEHGCRCFACVDARAEADRKYGAGR